MTDKRSHNSIAYSFILLFGLAAVTSSALAAKITSQLFDAPDVVVVPAGAFITGSNPAERELGYQLDERAYGHSVTREGRWYDFEAKRQELDVPAFAITKNLITNALYARFVTDTRHRAPGVDKKTWASYGLIHPYPRTRRHAWTNNQPPPGRLQHPVVLVSLKDAQAYAAWLSEKTGKTWQLPSEKQWEKAARGPKGLIFPWGNTFDPAKLNSHDSGAFDTTIVGKFQHGASPYGMLDAAGQVYEWTKPQQLHNVIWSKAAPGMTGDVVFAAVPHAMQGRTILSIF